MSNFAPERLKLVALLPLLDGTDVGETWSGFKWITALADRMDVTVLTLQRPGRPLAAEQVPNARVISWPEPSLLGRFERFRAMVKPAWPVLCFHAKRWLEDAHFRGERFDIAHQILPQAMRHSSPFRHFRIPYVIGPVGGSLSTPAAFESEMGKSSILTKLRRLDALRLRFDPGLNATFAKAEAVLGVAPYVADFLRRVDLKRFDVVLEHAADPIACGIGRSRTPGQLKMLHVGRVVRTKGLREVVRAMSRLRDLPELTLTSAGEGEDLAACRAEAAKLGVENRITFLGKIERAQVEELYASHDIFCFPSFREPMGGVLFEAMRWGLPVIAVKRGGPEAIVNERSGVLIDAHSPHQLADDIAAAVRTLAIDVARRDALSAGAHQRLQSFGDWPGKALAMEDLYRQVINTRASESSRSSI